MKKIYITKETQKTRDILNESYDYFLAAMKAKNPGAKSLIEDDTIKLTMRMRLLNWARLSSMSLKAKKTIWLLR